MGNLDTVDYSTSAAGINVDIRYNAPGRAGVGGDSEGDTLFNIEKVIGSAFNDTFSIDTISATFEGGAGDDVYILNTGSATVIEQVGGGNDEVRTNYGQISLNANVERLTYTGTGAFIGYGNASDNIITGGIGNDTLFGGDGADQFFGGAGMLPPETPVIELLSGACPFSTSFGAVVVTVPVVLPTSMVID
nr:hypothetical protein [Pseudomonas sp. HS6]